jgi:hypothetical protein
MEIDGICHAIDCGIHVESRNVFTKAHDGNRASLSAEVIQHLTSLIGAEVEVTMEIQARVAEGIPENVVRTVSENCKTLKFQTQGFEQD